MQFQEQCPGLYNQEVQPLTVAEQVSATLFDQQPTRISDISNDENAPNRVYRVETLEGQRCVIKVNPEASRVVDFVKGAWCQEQAHVKGISTPQAIAVGVEQSCAYFVQEDVSGTPLIHLPGENLETWYRVGRYTAHINTIPTVGFGRDFTSDGHYPTWQSYVQEGLQPEQTLALYTDNGLLTPQQARKAEKMIAEVAAWDFSPTLAHNDVYKNVLVTPRGEISFIDWDQASSTYAPYSDLAHLLPQLSPAQQEAFLTGYGINTFDFAVIQPYLEVMQLLVHRRTVESIIAIQDAQMLAFIKQGIASSSLADNVETQGYILPNQQEREARKRLYFCGSVEYVLGTEHGNCSGRLVDTGERIDPKEYLAIHFHPHPYGEEPKNRQQAIDFTRMGAEDALRIVDVLRTSKELQHVEWVIGITNYHLAEIAKKLGFQQLERDYKGRETEEGLVALAISKSDLLWNETRMRRIFTRGSKQLLLPQE